MRSFLRGASYPLRGLAFLAGRRSLWAWLAAPLLIHLVLLGTALAAFLVYRADLASAVLPATWTGWPRTLAAAGVQVAVALLGLLACISLGNVLAAPFLDALAGRVLAAAGAAAPAPVPAAAALGRAAVNQALQLAILGAVQSALFALWLTPAGPLHPFLSAAASAAFLAQECLDPALESLGLGPFARLRWIGRRAGAVAGFAAGLLPLLAVPLAGWLLLPAAVAGASLLARDLDSPPPVK
jgi:CysZ protein